MRFATLLLLKIVQPFFFPLMDIFHVWVAAAFTQNVRKNNSLTKKTTKEDEEEVDVSER